VNTLHQLKQIRIILAEPHWLQDPPGSGDGGSQDDNRAPFRSPRWRGNPPGSGVGSDLPDDVFDEQELQEAIQKEMVYNQDPESAKEDAKDGLYGLHDYSQDNE